MLASSSEYGRHHIGCLRPKRGEARTVLRPPSLAANRGHRARGRKVSSHLNHALGHPDGMATNAHGLKSAALHLQRQLDEARPSHFEALLDHALVQTIGQRIEAINHATKADSG